MVEVGLLIGFGVLLGSLLLAMEALQKLVGVLLSRTDIGQTLDYFQLDRAKLLMDIEGVVKGFRSNETEMPGISNTVIDLLDRGWHYARCGVVGESALDPQVEHIVRIRHFRHLGGRIQARPSEDALPASPVRVRTLREGRQIARQSRERGGPIARQPGEQRGRLVGLCDFRQRRRGGSRPLRR